MRGAVAGGHPQTAQAGARVLEAGGNAVDAAVAAALARNGVELNDGQAYLHRILDLILRHTPEARDVYEHDGAALAVGDMLVQPELAGTLGLLAERGAAELYHGELGAKVVEHLRTS